MTITDSKVKSVKSQKNSELKKSKTSAMLFFLTCLDEAVDINQLEEFHSLQHLSFDNQQQMIKAFKNLPHPELMFYQMINTYRGTRILKILDENINPVHLKKFSRVNSAEKNSKENKVECQLILKMVESNRQNYHEVLQLFIDSFEKNVREKWEKNEPNLLEQHLEKQKKLFAQRNTDYKILEVERTKSIEKIVQPLPSKPSTTTSPKKGIPSQNNITPVSNIENNLAISLTIENEKLTHAINTTPVKTSSHSATNTNGFQHKTTETSKVVKIEEKVNPSKNVATEIAILSDKNHQNNSVVANLPSHDFSANSQIISDNNELQKDLNNDVSKKLSIYEVAEQASLENPDLDRLFDISDWK